MKNIIVVGGGSAGVMSAYTLKKVFPEKNITILESENVPTVGVGESTLGGINQWMSMVDLHEEDFMRECNGSLKMSIRFENFYQKGDGGFHYPFGRPDTSNSIANLNDWYFKKILYPDTPVTDYALTHYPMMSLVNNNTILTDEMNKTLQLCPDLYSYKKEVAYHFDAVMFANWLKKRFVDIGGVVKKGDIKIVKESDNGIDTIVTDKLERYTADLFIDCTGWKSLLLGGTLKEPFDSYADMLPNNKAWATHLPYTNKEKEIKPYTNCTALDNGWVWNIPLWSRIGTGYVYSDKYVSDDDALDEFKKYLGRDDLEFRKLTMRVGLHERIFVKNVCAIGLSAGFIEPLESNGLLSVHEFLVRLVKILRDRPVVSTFVKDQFNANCKKFFREFAEFVATHYALSIRDDTEYWRDIQRRDYGVESSIKRIDSTFQNINEWSFDKFHYPNFSGMNCIAAGMNFHPTDEHTLKYGTRESDLNIFSDKWNKRIIQLERRKKEWDTKAKKCPSLYRHLKKLHIRSI